jgi:hypothetical protein
VSITLADIPGQYANPPDELISVLPKGGVKLDFVGHADITIQLIEVDPQWWWEPLSIDPETGGPAMYERKEMLVMWGKLHLLGTEIIEVGTCELKKPEADKEVIGDFLRRAAMRRGFATKLWSKTDREAGLNCPEPQTEPKAAQQWDEFRWGELAKRIKALSEGEREAILGDLVTNQLFKVNDKGERIPNKPFTNAKLAHIEQIINTHELHMTAGALGVLCEALECDDPINEPPEGVVLTQAMIDLAELSDCDEIDWKAQTKAFDVKPAEILHQAKEFAQKLEVDEPARLDEIRGEVAVELRLWLLAGQPF